MRGLYIPNHFKICYNDGTNNIAINGETNYMNREENEKIVTVAIAGLGLRGFHTYGQYQKIHPERMLVTAIADVDPKTLAAAAKDLNVPAECCFSSAEELLSKEKLADVLIVATQDRQHLAHTVAGLRLGYDVILEKPIAITPQDCLTIRNEAEKSGRVVAVCHVLRYTMFYRTIKEVIDSGRIGKIVNVDAVENVGYWHQAHSFVRGNWRNSQTSSPMILAKSCHDLDILNFLIGEKCKRLSSYGSLKFFRAENRPQGAADRCLDCKYRSGCVYSATEFYLSPDSLKEHEWFCYAVSPDGTHESLENALREGAYGRCVFACDNDVVDHQVVAMEYENGITATLTMSAFSSEMYRTVRIMGTHGEIEASQKDNVVRVTPFGGKTEYYDINVLASDLSGHGGGDNQMMTDFFARITEGKGRLSSSIAESVSSHMMAFAAEYSRLNGGESVEIETFEELIRSANR